MSRYLLEVLAKDNSNVWFLQKKSGVQFMDVQILIMERPAHKLYTGFFLQEPNVAYILS